MTEHVDEVHHEHVEVVVLQVVQLLQEAVAGSRVVHLMIGEGVLAAVAVEEGLDERSFIQVLPFLLVLIDPQFGEHLGNLVGHESAEDGIPCILCGGGQDAHIQLFLDVEQVTDLL